MVDFVEVVLSEQGGYLPSKEAEWLKDLILDVDLVESLRNELEHQFGFNKGIGYGINGS